MQFLVDPVAALQWNTAKGTQCRMEEGLGRIRSMKMCDMHPNLQRCDDEPSFCQFSACKFNHACGVHTHKYSERLPDVGVGKKP